MTPSFLQPASVRDTLLKAAVLVLATAWIYSPVYHGEFLRDWDDGLLVTNNWMVQSGSLGGLAAIWVEPDGPDYFPLTYTALWLQWQAFGDNPTGYHLVNIGLHALSGLLLWGLLTQLKLPGAWLAALVFTVHPVCVESVAWISEIKNTLSLPLFLLACWCWVRQDDCQQPTARNWWYAGSLLAFLLALLAKPTMVGLPLLTLLYAWWQRQTVSRQDLLRMLPMLLLAIGMGLVTVWFQHERAIGGEPLPIGGPLSRLAVAGMAIVFYLATIIWPVGLIPVYPQWSVQPVEPWQLLPWVGLAVAGWFSWRHRNSWGRHVIMAGGFFLLMVAPVLGFVDMAFMRIAWVSDHFLYLPMIGPLVALVANGTTWWQARPALLQTVGLAAAGGGVVLSSCMSHALAAHWVNSETLWTATIQDNKQAWPAYVGLGDERRKRDDLAAAAAFYAQAVQIHPPLASNQHYGNAVVEVLLKQRRYTEALATLEKSLQLDPHQDRQMTTARQWERVTKAYEWAKRIVEELRVAGCDDEELMIFYASVLVRNGEKAHARSVYLQLLAKNPTSERAQAGLSATSVIAD